MAAIIDEISFKYRYGGLLTRIIFINIGVFLLLRIAGVVSMLADHPEWQVSLMEWVELPSSPRLLLERPWTLITYMFAQYEVFHILFNMLWLYWFGTIFLQINNPRRLMGLYIYGGLGGALLFILSYNLFPGLTGINSWLIGSSAAAIAIVVATAATLPDHKVGLLFIGEVALKWIALVTIVIDFISVTGDNAGGHISHLGGAIVGFVFALALKRGIDITAPFNNVIDHVVNLMKRITHLSLSRRTAGFSKSTTHASSASRSDEDILNEILDKIKKSGYGSLTPEERNRLFDVSSRIK